MAVEERLGVIKEQVVTDRYAIYLGDCMEMMQALPAASIELSVYSPPFGGLYSYSSSDRDLSNCTDYVAFFKHYDYVIGEIARLTKPGRVTAVHCADIPTGNSGTDARIDLPGDITRAHAGCQNDKCEAHQLMRNQGLCGHGRFKLMAKYDVWKEPLAVRNRTMAKNLAHRSLVEDSSRCSNASADYVLVFRRNGPNATPIAHPEGLMSYAGEREIPAELLPYRGWTGNQIENRFSHWIWRQYASAFWDDVRVDRVLPFEAGRDDQDEKHIHPLQLDVIERIVTLWSNPGETVLTPFMGIGSEVWGAVTAGRRGIGAELKESYYRQAVRNLAEAALAPVAAQSDIRELLAGAQA